MTMAAVDEQQFTQDGQFNQISSSSGQINITAESISYTSNVKKLCNIQLSFCVSYASIIFVTIIVSISERFNDHGYNNREPIHTI